MDSNVNIKLKQECNGLQHKKISVYHWFYFQHKLCTWSIFQMITKMQFYVVVIMSHELLANCVKNAKCNQQHIFSTLFSRQTIYLLLLLFQALRILLIFVENMLHAKDNGGS